MAVFGQTACAYIISNLGEQLECVCKLSHRSKKGEARVSNRDMKCLHLLSN